MDEAYRASLKEAARRLLVPFGEGTVVYAARCCGRLFIGKKPPTRCRSCGSVPNTATIGSVEELDNFIA